MGTTQVVVGRVGRAHGLRGEVALHPRTDEPDVRFAPGSRLVTQSAQGAQGAQGAEGAEGTATLTVQSSRWHQGRLLVRFAELTDRTAAESVRGLTLLVEVDPGRRPEDPEEYYDHQLVGLRVETTDGAAVGRVTAVTHGTAQDLLAVATEDGEEVLVPFVAALVPDVDLGAGRLRVADRPGLLGQAGT